MDTYKITSGIKLYTEKEFSGLSQEQKERHCETVVRKILENVKDGVTISEIQVAVPYLGADKTIQRHLDKYVNTNFAYKKLIGRAYLYFHNGRLLHEALKEDIPLGKKLYSVYHIKNSDGDFIFIQEKKKDELKSVIISGGIIVEKEFFPEFLEHLNAIDRKVNKDGKEN